MTRERLLYILAFFLTLFVYLWHGSPVTALLLLLFVLYALAAFAFSRIAGRGLEAVMSAGGMVEKGEDLEAKVEIRQDGRVPVPLLKGKIQAVNRLTGEEQYLPLACSLPPKGARQRKTSLTDQFCGKVELSLKELTAGDPLGLFRGKRECPASAFGYFAPVITPAAVEREALDSYDMESYQYSQYEKGSDPGEVFGIREYREGDSLKQIHWKLSAKMDEVMVKIPSFPIENNIILMLDNLLVPDSPSTPEERSRLVERFYSLSAALLEKDIHHTIGWYDVDQQVYMTRRIGNREELQASIPDVLGCGFEESEVSTVYRYLEGLEGQGFSNHFLVTLQEERDADRLENYGAVKVFRATE